MKLSFLVCMAVLCTMAAVTGCRRAQPSGPPVIRLGLDPCAECGMLVMEEHCSCALLIAEDDQHEYVFFDDLGCLLDYQCNNPQIQVVDTFVRDFKTSVWTTGINAHYVFSDVHAVSTPMGSGMVAFALESAAQDHRAASSGKLHTFQELAQARRQWRAHRQSQTVGAP